MHYVRYSPSLFMRRVLCTLRGMKGRDHSNGRHPSRINTHGGGSSRSGQSSSPTGKNKAGATGGPVRRPSVARF